MGVIVAGSNRTAGHPFQSLRPIRIAIPVANPSPLRCLILESEPLRAREARRESVGRSSGETYCRMLRALDPSAACDVVRPADPGACLPDGAALEGYDAVFLTGSPLHLYEDTPQTARQVALMRAVFASGTPAFGSCAGLQVATVAAGGTVRPSARGREAAFARRIARTQAGRTHPLLDGRPDVYDAPAIHTDEVASLPEGAVRLAGNRIAQVQAAEIRHGGGVFWGVQYHPELGLDEIAGALRRQAQDLVGEGFGASEAEIDAQASLIERLHAAPCAKDLAWRLGLDEQVTDEGERSRELSNFIRHLARPTKSARGRA